MEMNTRKLVIGILAFLLVSGGGFFLYIHMQGSDAPMMDTDTNDSETEVLDDGETAEAEQEMSVTHFYTEEDGEHTLIGMAPVPTPCHELWTNVGVIEGIDGRDRANVSFDVVNESEVACAQVITMKTFRVRFRGEENIPVQILWNGAPVDIAIENAPPGSDPDLYRI